MSVKSSVGILTLGCRVNQYESEAIAKELEEKGFEIKNFEDLCDYYIINTCTVTAESDRKSRQMIRRAVNNNPNARVLVCGCYSQMFESDVAKIKGVDYITGNREKLSVVKRIIDYSENKYENRGVSDVMSLDNALFEKMSASKQDRTRAFLKIEDGCENKCSYCIIPRARGKIRSKPIEETFLEVKEIAENGYKEIVLVGIETAAYGKDAGIGLIDLLEKLETVDGIERIRMGSIEPFYLKPDIIDRLSKLKKCMPHYHLAIQSGCDNTLHAMKRRYNIKTVNEIIERMREKIPNVTFGSDFIAGFPNETQADFEDTLEFLKTSHILNSHIFAYSRRPGTVADSMENQIDGQTKKQRAALMKRVCDEEKEKIIRRFIDNKTVLSVLFESEKNGKNTGHTENFIQVEADVNDDLSDKILNVNLTHYDKKTGITKCKIL